MVQELGDEHEPVQELLLTTLSKVRAAAVAAAARRVQLSDAIIARRQCAIDIRHRLAASVLLVGGGAAVEGLPSRLLEHVAEALRAPQWLELQGTSIHALVRMNQAHELSLICAVAARVARYRMRRSLRLR